MGMVSKYPQALWEHRSKFLAKMPLEPNLAKQAGANAAQKVEGVLPGQLGWTRGRKVMDEGVRGCAGDSSHWVCTLNVRCKVLMKGLISYTEVPGFYSVGSESQ